MSIFRLPEPALVRSVLVAITGASAEHRQAVRAQLTADLAAKKAVAAGCAR